MPLRGFAPATRSGGRGVQQRQRFAALTVVGFAFGGEAEAAAVALHQADAELFFQMIQVFARHRGGDAEAFGSAGEARAFDDLLKDFEAEQGIHRFLMRKVASMRRV